MKKVDKFYVLLLDGDVWIRTFWTNKRDSAMRSASPVTSLEAAQKCLNNARLSGPDKTYAIEKA